MKNIAKLAALATLVVALAACKPDAPIDPPTATTGKFELNFRLEWAGQSGYLGLPYRNPYNGDSVVLDALKFYVSNVRLVKADGTEHPITDLHLFNFRTNSSVGKVAHLVGEALAANVPLGHYNGIRYTIGLTSAQNATDPTTLPATHLLSDFQGMFWSWATGYRFFLLEGRMDTIPNDGNEVFSHGLSWHYGGNDLRIERELVGTTYHFEVRTSQETQFIQFFDIASILTPFQSGLDTLNLRTQNITHQSSVAETELAHKVKSNFAAAIQTAIAYVQ
jgi:hypothetical protein